MYHRCDQSEELTEFLLDDLENFLLIELLRQALNSCQCLTTIALWNPDSQIMLPKSRRVVAERLTLDPYVDVILRLLSLASVFVGFGEGVCTSSQHMLTTIARSVSPARTAGEIFVM